MSQADSPDTTNPSRRRALVGLLSVAPTAIVAKSLAGTPAGDDSELLALKPRFDQLWNEWIARTVAEAAEQRSWIAAISVETGIKSKPEINWNDPTWIAWDTASSKLLDQEIESGRDLEEEERRFNRFIDVSGSLAKEIICSYHATTLDGLRLQARALMLEDYDTIWSAAPDFCEEEPNNQRLHDFFESLCAFLDVPFPPIPDAAGRLG
jgi:hypothetical protein